MKFLIFAFILLLPLQDKVFFVAENDTYSMLIPITSKVSSVEDEEAGKIDNIIIFNDDKPQYLLSLGLEAVDSTNTFAYPDLMTKMADEYSCEVTDITQIELNNSIATKMTLENIKNEDQVFSGYLYLIKGKSDLVILNCFALFIVDDDDNKLEVNDILETLEVNF